MADEQHIYHHNDPQPKVTISVEKNSKGYTYGATVINESSVDEAIKKAKQAMKALEKEYGANMDS